MTFALRSLFIASMLALTSCAQLGLPTATTFQDRLTAGYALNAEVRSTSTALLNAKKISSVDAENVLNQNDNARAGLDIARTIGRADPKAGDTKLTSIRTVLIALQGYLATKKGN